jgi:hypothetical protein
MKTEQAVERLLAVTSRRRRWLHGWQGLWRGLLVGSVVYLLGLTLYKLAPVPWIVVQVALWTGLLALPVGFLMGWLRRVTPSDTARFLDREAGLKERLSTAVEVSGKATDGFWRDLVVRDATVSAAGVDHRKILPIRLPAFSRWAVVVLAAAAGLGFAPEWRSKAQQQAVLDSGVIQDVGRNLVLVTKKELNEKRPTPEPTRRALEEIGELGERLQTAKLTRDDALRDLAKVTEEMRQKSLDLAKNTSLKRMERAARNSGSNPQQSSQALQRKMDELQRQLGDRAADADSAKELKKDLEEIKEAARAMANQDGAAGDAARQEMARALSELGQKAQDMGMPLESLNDAAAALAAANVEQFLKDLEFAEKDLEKMIEMAQMLAKMQQQSEQMGKDLAEQLENGQAEAAIETLQKMIDQLKQPGLSPEEMAKLIEDVVKATKAGQQYGEVGHYLKKAAGECQGGKAGEGSKNLEMAQAELAKLLDEMGESQALMAAMDALQKAQMCVGNGLCWSQCSGSSNDGRIGAGKSGRGGRGVGTWSDNDAWAMPDGIQDLWDNSGVERPDMDGRGLTERDQVTPNALVPTKVKGQMQPGGPMPSITLKGVSIKGESKVEYSEAVTSAQSDARAALNQEEVPKAYRNAVRDYFDDLK